MSTSVQAPVQLSPEDVAELRKKLSTARHDVNNALSLIAAAAELIRLNPDMAGRMLPTLSEQSPKIAAALQAFSNDLEKALGVRR